MEFVGNVRNKKRVNFNFSTMFGTKTTVNCNLSVTLGTKRGLITTSRQCSGLRAVVNRNLSTLFRADVFVPKFFTVTFSFRQLALYFNHLTKRYKELLYLLLHGEGSPNYNFVSILPQNFVSCLIHLQPDFFRDR